MASQTARRQSRSETPQAARPPGTATAACQLLELVRRRIPESFSLPPLDPFCSTHDLPKKNLPLMRLRARAPSLICRVKHPNFAQSEKAMVGLRNTYNDVGQSLSHG